MTVAQLSGSQFVAADISNSAVETHRPGFPGLLTGQREHAGRRTVSRRGPPEALRHQESITWQIGDQAIAPNTVRAGEATQVSTESDLGIGAAGLVTVVLGLISVDRSRQ